MRQGIIKMRTIVEGKGVVGWQAAVDLPAPTLEDVRLLEELETDLLFLFSTTTVH